MLVIYFLVLLAIAIGVAFVVTRFVDRWMAPAAQAAQPVPAPASPRPDNAALPLESKTDWLQIIVAGGWLAICAGLCGLTLWSFPILLIISAVYVGCCFTPTKESSSKQIMRGDGYLKTVFQRKGYALVAGTAIALNKLSLWERFYHNGFHISGYHFTTFLFPLGFDTVFVGPLEFLKSLPKGKETDPTFEIHTEETDGVTDFLYTLKLYPYALLFTSCEDSNGLPINGQITMVAEIVNPYKALFAVRSFYDILSSTVSEQVRALIATQTYGQLLADKDLHEKTYKILKKKKKIKQLEDDYGIHLKELQWVNIDPPKGYRDVTLRKYVAEQNAIAEAEETGGALDRMIDTRTEKTTARLKKLGWSDADIQAHFKKPETVERVENQQLDLLRRDRAGSGLRDIRVGNVDGTPLDPIEAAIMSAIGAAKSGNYEGKPSTTAAATTGNYGGEPSTTAAATSKTPDPQSVTQANWDWYYERYKEYAPDDPRGSKKGS